jgi:myo-inositol 2-dehydrogenase/D-chiro-inositol 1-dehydrogenase
MPNARSVAVGLIGAGGMGMRHAENLHRHVGAAHVAAAYDLDRGRAEQVAALCGTAVVHDDPLRLIQDDRIEAVIIASPDATHAGFVQECLRWGKPVLCEKPLATSAADAAQVIEAECALGRRLVSVGLMRRFDPSTSLFTRWPRRGPLAVPSCTKVCTAMRRSPTTCGVR